MTNGETWKKRFRGLADIDLHFERKGHLTLVDHLRSGVHSIPLFWDG